MDKTRIINGKAYTRIKICGLQSISDVMAVNEVMPDYAGFVFAKSSRQISEEIAGRLKHELAPGIVSVGVFVNEEMEKILRLCERRIIDMIQLHGDEDRVYIDTLRSMIKTPVVKAIRVRSSEDILLAEGMDTEYLLLDAYLEKEYGGSGVKFDWSLIPELKKPFFLAGGLNSENVLDAIRRYQPYGIDVSTGVETGGYKDLVKLRKLVEVIRQSDVDEGL